jgi:hypothetical protein
VGSVTAFSIPGLDLWFNSSAHLPPHFHARKPGRWEVRVFILDCAPARLALTVKWPRHGGGGPRGRERRALLEGTLANRLELLLEWERKVIPGEDR